MNTDDLELSDEAIEAIERKVNDAVRDAVAGSATRDALLAELDLQLEGRLIQNGTQRWRNSCILNDPMSRQAHLQLLAMITQAQRKDPKWTVESDDPDKVDNASIMESWLMRKSYQYELSKVFYDVAYIALRDMCCPLYVGWTERVRTVYPKKYQLLDENDEDVEDADPVRYEHRDPNKFYRQVEGEPEDIVEHAGCEFRAVDLSDFYVYPSNAQSVKKAVATAERMLLTEDQLWDGIADYGYNEERVEELVAQGPTHSTDSNGSLFEIRNSYDGTNSGAETETRDGFYECFLVFMRAPRRYGSEEIDIPDKLKHKDLKIMVCPSRRVTFQIAESPYQERPYIMYDMLKRPNRLLGIGAMQLIAGLQEEATANLQLTIDSMNLEMSPCLISPYEWIEKYSAFTIYPGAVLPEDVPGSLRALEWRRQPNQGLELQASIVDRGMGLVAAEGYGVMQPKVRKAAEISNVMNAADVKFDLFLQVIQTPMAELAERIVSLHLQFDPLIQETFIAGAGRRVTVTPDMLRGEYRFVPTATSSTGTPEARLQITMAKLELLKEYIALMTESPPQFWPMIWHAVRSALIDMDERNPIAYIGPEPKPQMIPAPQPGMAPGAPGGAPPISVPPQLVALSQAGVDPRVIAQLQAAAAPGNNPAQLAHGAVPNG